MTAQTWNAQVATAGEALIDLIGDADGRFKPCLGGAVFNLTRALARQGVQTLYLNPLSRDRFGRQLAAALENDGVCLAVPKAVQQVTSLAVVNVDSKGQPDYAFYREGVADRACSANDLIHACTQAKALSMVCSGALALSPNDADIYLPWLASQYDAGKTVVIDANLRPSVMPDLESYQQHVLRVLQYADIIKASDEDLACLNLPGANVIERASHLLQYSRAHFVALTCGAEGAALLTRQGQVFYAREMQKIEVTDTVGAGDCFLAGLLASVLELALPRAWGSTAVDTQQAHYVLQNAVASASICVMRQGCEPPRREEVLERLAHNTINHDALIFSAI